MKKLFAIALVLLCASPASAAEDCRLKLLASLDISFTKDGSPTIPVTVGGKEYAFALELEAMHSAVTEKLGADIGAERRRLPMVVNYDNQETQRSATLPPVKIGNTTVTEFEAILLPKETLAGTEGAIGLDLLQNFDVELDLSAKKLKLFSQQHCEGQVVYWGKSYAVVPFYQGALTNIFVKSTLDGNEVPASFSTHEEEAALGMWDAHKYLRLQTSDPKLVKRTDIDPGRDESNSSYPFSTLTLGGVSITNPDIVLHPQRASDACTISLEDIKAHRGKWNCISSGILLLGRKQLRALHLYFAFSEKNLYVTAADPAPPPPAP